MKKLITLLFLGLYLPTLVKSQPTDSSGKVVPLDIKTVVPYKSNQYTFVNMWPVVMVLPDHKDLVRGVMDSNKRFYVVERDSVLVEVCPELYHIIRWH